jgi:hypothetical protein
VRSGGQEEEALSAMTAVRTKSVRDSIGLCFMRWPLDGAEVVLLEEGLAREPGPSLDELGLVQLPVLLYCRLPPSATPAEGEGEGEGEGDMITVQVDLYCGEKRAPPRTSTLPRRFLMTGESISVFNNLPHLFLMELFPDEDPAEGGGGGGSSQCSVVVSVYSGREGLLYASLEARLHFQSANRLLQGRWSQLPSTPSPPHFHSEMTRLGREYFFALLNVLNLTSVAVEIGVDRGVFSTHMLKHWRGER